MWAHALSRGLVLGDWALGVGLGVQRGGLGCGADTAWGRQIMAMYLGVIVFGILLSEVQASIAQYNALQRAAARVKQEARFFLRSQDVPFELERRVLKWVDFDLKFQQEHDLKQRTLDIIPPSLRRALYSHLHRDMLRKVRWRRLARGGMWCMRRCRRAQRCLGGGRGAAGASGLGRGTRYQWEW